MTAPVPIIDLSSPKHAVVAQVLEACTQSGFFLVSNHGVPRELIQRHRLQQRLFFVKFPLRPPLSRNETTLLKYLEKCHRRTRAA